MMSSVALGYEIAWSTSRSHQPPPSKVVILSLQVAVSSAQIVREVGISTTLVATREGTTDIFPTSSDPGAQPLEQNVSDRLHRHELQ